MKATLVAVSLVAAGVFDSPMSTHASDSPWRPPAERGLQGAWVGIGETGVPIYRLVLDSGGKGLLASYDVRAPSLLAWRVTSWRSQDGKVSMDFLPATNSARDIRGDARAERCWMSDVLTFTMEIPGTTNAAQKIVLRKEGDQAQVLQQLNDWMHAYSSAGVTNATTGQPVGPANGSQPIRSETNSTSAAAGSRR